MTKKPEDIMTEYLLNGAKMLSELCPKCEAPLFEVKGKKMCVVCANTPKEETAQKKSAENIQMIVPKYAAADQTSSPAPENILAGLDDLILKLCIRAAAETEPERCLTLIECIRTAAEAKTILSR
ncbi:MAG: autoantigen p27 domain-containing protein [Methanocorpusculum sp.]|uniref:autoantigen p27 domain-containing protein n=1 Tax=Methanocorpusculum sp. TaxID=2058474 RepID=UPI00272082E6|nr:autoantigen p27 domain-containing protein [Methanocorpusculum sp.]MDO9523424.1 autoantigen p27 domain-containing protein [Methanocorpusculum sp.]